MAQNLTVTCPQCGQQSVVPPDAVGKTGRCNRCGHRFVITAQQPPASSLPPYIQVACACGREFRIPREHMGRQAKCPYCGQDLPIPVGDSTPTTLEKASLQPVLPAQRPVIPEPEESPTSRVGIHLAGAAVTLAALLALIFLLVRGWGSKPTPRPVAQVQVTATSQPAFSGFPKTAASGPSSSNDASASQPAAGSDPSLTGLAAGLAATTLPDDSEVETPATAPADLATGPGNTESTPDQSADVEALENIPAADMVHVFENECSHISSLLLAPDGQRLYVATGKPDYEIVIWQVDPPKEIGHLKGHKGFITGLAFSMDGTQLLSSSTDKTLRVWDLRTRREKRQFSHDGKEIEDVAVVTGNAVSVGRDDILRVWNLSTGKPIRGIPTRARNTVAFLPDNRSVLSAGWPPDAFIWDTSTGKEVRKLTVGNVYAIADVAVSADGRFLAASGVYHERDPETKRTKYSPFLRLWDSQDEWREQDLKAAPGKVSAIAFSPNARFLISGGHCYSVKAPDEDRRIQLWDVETGREVLNYTNGRTVYALAFTADGRRVAAGFGGGETALLDLPEFAWEDPPIVASEVANEPGLDAGDSAPENEPLDLAEISKTLRTTVPALIKGGDREQARTLLLQADAGLRQYAADNGLELWESKVALLMRRVDDGFDEMVKTTEPSTGGQENAGSADGASANNSANSDRPRTKLTDDEMKEMRTLRSQVVQARADIRRGKTSEAKRQLDRTEKELADFVKRNHLAPWTSTISSVFQLVEKCRSELQTREVAEQDKAAKTEAERKDKEEAEAEAIKKQLDSIPSRSSALTVGDPCPGFVAETLDGKPFNIAQFRGQWILIDFWATWCGPCLGEMKNLQDVFETFGKNKRFALVSLSIDEDREKLRKYLDSHKEIAWYQGCLDYGWKSPVIKAWGVHGIPAIYLVDPRGRIAAVKVRGDNIKKAVGDALGR